MVKLENIEGHYSGKEKFIMKEKWMAVAALLCVACVAAGCGKKDIKIADLKDVETEDYVTLPDYKNLPVLRPEKVVITDADVKSYINSRIDAVSDMHELTGTIENGDVLNIDYAGTIDGTAFEGGTAKGQLLEIGSGSFIEGFEEGLIGASVGETKELSLKFPDGYRNADVAGKECVFAVKINYILSALTDENVFMVDAGYESAEVYREDAGNMLREYMEYQYERELENGIATSLISGSTYQEIPQSLVDDYKESLRTDFNNAAAAAGMSLEDYMMDVYRVPAENLEDNLGIMAERCAKEGLALQAIADKEGISVSDEELEEVVSDLAETVGDTEGEPDKENIRVNLLYNKVYEFLMDIYGE